MFYKVENEKLIKAPEKSLKIFIANPTDEQYRFFGYTDKITEDEIPEVEEGKIIEEYYVQEDDVIRKKYRVIDIPEPQVETE
ncbi:MAG: hypothetical protein J6R68_04070 [Clostridia bacterium]|nr:hypothetical protein [Clostridia bacterium]